MSKSLLSNLIAAALVLVGLLMGGPWSGVVLNTGLFALSGGITNWLAIHMLFERVPGLYGSGVVQLRFEEFKRGIRELIMEQFFDRADLQASFQGLGEQSEGLRSALGEAIDEVNLDGAFDSLLEVIMSSSFAGMLGMIGGKEALTSLKDPFVRRMRDYLKTQLARGKLDRYMATALGKALDEEAIRSRLAALIDRRLEQLTPVMVKDIVKRMIREHLGWLVVWGCAFGGLIGFIVSLAGILTQQ